jgi:uncharacterized damage-inducible protein DinB
VTEDRLREHLRWQLRSGYRSVERAIEGLTEAQALEGAQSDWRRYRWGSGLDGSIAGIVWHLALWKQNFAQGLETGQFPAEESLKPPGTDWGSLISWLAEGQARLVAAVDRLSEAELAAPREWEGMTEPLARLLSFLIEHDFYHAGQIELLRQLRGYPSGAD